MKFESEEFTASLFPGYNFTTESEFIYNDLKLDSLLSPKTLVENLKESHDYETLKSTIKTKFTHHGKISLYKSKIQLSETKRLNELRNQVTFIKTSITSKTDLLNELEAQFLDQKNTYRKIISSLETTCFKITSRFDSNPFPFANSLKIAITCTSPFKNVVISCKELESIPDSLLKFQKITNNYVLNDAEIKKLYHEFDTLFDKLINLLHKIDEIEGLISSTSSDLSKCIHQEEKYSQVSRKINELDIIEGIEGIILNEIIKEQKLESKIIQKQARVQENHKLELEARQKEISDLQLKSRLDENWNKFQIRLHETLEKQEKLNLESSLLLKSATESKKASMDKLSNECTKIRRFMKVEASSPKDLALRNLKLKEAEIQKRKSDIVGKIIAEEERERKSKLASRSIPTNRKPSKTDIVEDIEKLKEPDLFIKEKVLENASSSEIDNIISTQQTFQTEKKHLPPPNIKPIKKPEQSIKIVSKSIFTFTPTQVIFKDYEPGKKYSQKVNLTNTSGFQNSYRLVNLSEELQDYFEVVFVPPGKMSAGTTRSMTILFTPTIDFNQDLQGHVLLVAEHGGEFTIPLICLKQDCIPRLVDGNLLSFGDCVVDGYLKRNIILENIGSLSASYSIENIDQKEDSCFSITDRNGLLNGYSTNSIQVDFKSSKTTGKISEKFRIVFKDVTQLEFTAECNIFDVPVHASINVVDFKTCVIGNLYREVVSLENSGSSALKFEIKVQKEHLQYILVRDPNVTKLGQASSGSLVLRIPNVGDIEILPRMAYIQPRNTFPLRFKFSPAGKSSEIDFALPVLIAYKAFGLDCVIKLDMKGSLTSNELTFELEGGDKSVLNFGISSILEMSQKSLKISNMSHLPQTLKFKSDSSALLLDSSTDIIVGARDSLQICLNFAPQEAQKHNIKFNFESNMKKLYEFRAVGKGIFPLLKFNYNNIEFEPTAIGSFANQKVSLIREKMVEERPDHLPWSKKNKKEIENDNLVTFEFLKPTISSQFVSDLPLDENDFTFIEDGLIRIYPTKGELKMGEKSTIEITLSPSINLPGVKLAIEKRQETILANEAEYANEMAKRDAEIKERDIASAMASKKKGVPKAKQVVEEEKVVIEIPALVKKDAPAMDFFKSYRDSKVTLIVPCKTRIIESEASRQKRFVNGSKTPIKQTPIQSIEEHIIYLSITAVVCKPEFVVEQWPDSAVNDEKSANPTTQLKMGKIDFGIIPVYEHSVKKMKLKSNGFKVDLKSNLFDLKGPFYLAKALREFDISESVHFGFKPEIVGKFQTNTRLFSNGTQVSINMIGEGVIPSLLLEPLKGKLLFADKLIGEVSNGTFKVHNPCHFPISCKFQINDEGAFTLSPTETVIPPGARQEVEVQFKPIRESDFLTIVKIQYLGQQKDCLFSLAGRGWEISATLLGYDEISQGISKNFATEGEGETLSRPQSREMSMQSIPLALQSTVQIPNSIATRIDVRYVTYSCSWKKVDDSDLNNITTYTIEAPEISITNFKPTAKLENVGGNTKATSASFTIERITSGFEYNEDTGLIKITNLENSKKQSYKFEIEPMTGAVEIGGMKNLAIKIVKIDSEKVDNESVADKKKKPVKNEEVRPSTDITEPLNVESFFRIKIRGGYRASEPKGIFADKRDFIVRLVV